MSMGKAPPQIFDPQRRVAVRRRMRRLQQGSDAARFILDDMVEDVRERLAFLRFQPAKALVVGDWTGELAAAFADDGGEVTRADPAPLPGEGALDEERPYPNSGHDLIVSLGLLDTVNDLPGALIHIRNALAPGGLAIASFLGAGSLPVLRQAMLSADGARPAARIHPMVDVRAGAELIQRAGWADPVVDGHGLQVRYSSLPRLVADLRAQGLSNVLASRAPQLTKEDYARAEAAFIEKADAEGRVTETFEIVTLSGRRPGGGPAG